MNRHVDPDVLAEILGTDPWRGFERDIEKRGPLSTFPWHKQQEWALTAATNTVMVLGGNQSGKTTVGAGVVARLVRREGPIYRRLRNPEKRPLRIWVSPQTDEKYESNWEPRLVGDVFAGTTFDYKRSPAVFRWEDEVTRSRGLPPNELWGKSQKQGFLAFESDVVDLIVFDEEPEDPKVYNSSLQRFSTTNGVCLLAFTPLLGLSWTYSRLLVPTKKPEYKVADRVWRRGNAVTVIQMGMADNPSSIEGGGVARLRSDPGIMEAERRTRLYGEYGFAEGLIFPMYADLMMEEA